MSPPPSQPDGTAGALPDAAEVIARLERIRARIAAAGGDPAGVKVLAVTKGHPPQVLDLARAAGLLDVGENYAQELLAKLEWLAGRPPSSGADAAPAALRWHFIGHLQRNKVRQLAPHVSCWQSIDRAELIVEVAKRSPGAHLLIQVNATGEPQKAGCHPDQVGALVEQARAAGCAVDGLMTVGPTDETVDPRPGFVAVRALVDALGLQVCSMGMTDDLEAAVACGSTMVRIGTALFGPRAPRPAVGN